MSASDKRSEIIIDIINGEISKDELVRRLNDLEQEFGESAYTSYVFSKKEKPWNDEYYKQLEKQALGGAGSKDFIKYLHEVKSAVNNDNKSTVAKVLKGIVRILSAAVELIKKHPIVTMVVVVIAVVGIILLLR